MQKSVRLDKYSDCESSLETYLQIGDMILNDNLSLNIYVVPTVINLGFRVNIKAYPYIE